MALIILLVLNLIVLIYTIAKYIYLDEEHENQLNDLTNEILARQHTIERLEKKIERLSGSSCE